jgi:hypothetical protein
LPGARAKCNELLDALDGEVHALRQFEQLGRVEAAQMLVSTQETGAK